MTSTARRLALAAAFSILPLAQFRAQETPVRGSPAVNGAAAGGSRLTLHVTRAAGEIRIDGDLEDAGWQGAARAVGFTEFAPRKRATPPVETEALVTYDEHHLYVAFMAHGDPRAIRATLRDRDQVFGDDIVGVLIDTYGDGASAVFLIVNALGVQGDMLFSPRGEDDSFDVIFKSAAKIVETGYQVEIAIPFRSLRFPSRAVHNWQINFYRNLPRSVSHDIAWAPLDTDNPCILCQSAALVGLEGIQAGGKLELLPAMIAGQTGALADSDDPRSAFDLTRPKFDGSLGAKYAFESGWTAEGTVNPDFSQVESDAAQVDVNTTFALFFPERRPFFQEGSDLFETPANIVYTRSINAPITAAKVTGRFGENTRVAFLGAVDQHTPFIVPFEERSMVLQGGRSVSNVLRVQHGIREDSHVGLLVADRRLDAGGSGSNVSLDAALRFAKSYRVRAQFVSSHTREPDDSALTEGTTRTFGRGRTYTAAFDGERFAGHNAFISVNRSARVWEFDVNYSEVSPTYRADNGFQTRNDLRSSRGWTSVSFYPETWIVRISPNLRWGSIWNFGGQQKDVWLNPGLSLTLPRQTYVNLNGVVSSERFRDIDFHGIRRVHFNLNTSPNRIVSFGFFAGAGRSIARNESPPELGDFRDFAAWGSFKPVQRLVIEPEVNWTRLDRLNGENIFEGYLFRARTNYQFTRELLVRVVTQYNGFADRLDLEPLVMYRLNPFSIFYLGSTHGYRDFDSPHGWVGTDRQYFLKFQYLLRL